MVAGRAEDDDDDQIRVLVVGNWLSPPRIGGIPRVLLELADDDLQGACTAVTRKDVVLHTKAAVRREKIIPPGMIVRASRNQKLPPIG
jgi:hypothetical protein